MSPAKIVPILTLAFISQLAFRSPATRAADVEITFRLHAPDLADDAKVFIAGSVSGLGNWEPGKVRMTAAKDHVWIYQLAAVDGQTIEYKYTLGSWEREGAGADGRPLPNFSIGIHGPTVQDDTVNFWTNGQRRELHGQITGAVRYHRAMTGDGILPRDVIVWLPAGYPETVEPGEPAKEPTTRYPVLYMHDGQNIIDPATSSFGTDWEVDEACTRLIAEKKIPPLIVVGIYNTPERNQEYLPGPKGTAYMDFVTRRLKPFIDAHYRTEPGRETTFVGGSSAGGLSAFMLAWEHSDVFGGAICMSPAFRIEKKDSGDSSIDYVTTVEKSEPPKPPVFFYVDVGGVGLEASLQPGVDAMLAALKAKNLQEGSNYVYVRDPEARHFEAAWAKRFPAAVQSMFASHGKQKSASSTEASEFGPQSRRGQTLPPGTFLRHNDDLPRGGAAR
jgi:predicted alpha/beta superfamily hydrolase